MINKFIDNQHDLLLIIGVLLIVIVLLGASKSLAPLISILCKKLLGKEKLVIDIKPANLIPQQQEALGCLINPENCPKHEAETQRSLQNKRDIEKLEGMINTDRDVFWKELKAIRRGISVINFGLIKKNIIDPRDIPKEDL